MDGKQQNVSDIIQSIGRPFQSCHCISFSCGEKLTSDEAGSALRGLDVKEAECIGMAYAAAEAAALTDVLALTVSVVVVVSVSSCEEVRSADDSSVMELQWRWLLWLLL